MYAFFFWLFSVGMIVCGLSVILNRNAVASALSFAFTIVFMSGLFVMLSAFFLAAVQILVTAGAVMVLFLFIIMLLDLTKMEHIPRQKIWMGCALVLALGFIYIVARTLNETPQGAVTINNAPLPSNLSAGQINALAKAHPGSSENYLSDFNDDTHRIGRLLFSTPAVETHPGGLREIPTTYVAPFEITSLLILIATIGVIVICKQEPRRRPGPDEEIVREAPPIDPKKETTLTR